MNILLVGPGDFRGGIETHIALLAHAFRGSRVRYQLATLRDGWPDMGIPTHILRKRFRGDPNTIPRLLRIIRQERIDIVHTHHIGPNLYGRLAARLADNVGLVSTNHASNSGGITPPHRQTPNVFDEIIFWSDLCMAHLCDRVVAPVNVIHRSLRKVHVPDGRIVDIPYPVDARRFRMDEAARRRVRSELGIPDSAVVLGIVGRLVPVKNMSLFLRGLKRAAEVGGANVMGVIVGEGPLRPDLEAEVSRLNLRDRLIFAGFRSDVPDVLSAVDIAVVTSHSECSPYCVWEPMLVGKPVVTSRVGGVGEILESGKHALLFPPGDEDALAEALSRVVADPGLRQELGSSGRRRVEGRLSLDAMVKRLLATYDEVMALHGRRDDKAD